MEPKTIELIKQGEVIKDVSLITVRSLKGKDYDQIGRLDAYTDWFERLSAPHKIVGIAERAQVVLIFETGALSRLDIVSYAQAIVGADSSETLRLKVRELRDAIPQLFIS